MISPSVIADLVSQVTAKSTIPVVEGSTGLGIIYWYVDMAIPRFGADDRKKKRLSPVARAFSAMSDAFRFCKK